MLERAIFILHPQGLRNSGCSNYREKKGERERGKQEKRNYYRNLDLIYYRCKSVLGHVVLFLDGLQQGAAVECSSSKEIYAMDCKCLEPERLWVSAAVCFDILCVCSLLLATWLC